MEVILSLAEQRTNWNVALPRDPSMVKAEGEWAAFKAGPAPARLTADEALAVSKQLTDEIIVRCGTLRVGRK